MNKEPLVSVCMVTYNHESYIARAIESVLMQKTDFPFELVVSDDCSSDGTVEICRSYKDRYPDRIRLLLSEKRLGVTGNGVKTLDACTGKYIALCDGDDFWTSPDKLQKQADIMETHEEYVICAHLCCFYHQDEEIVRPAHTPALLKDGADGFEFTNSQRIRGLYLMALSCFFRRDRLPGKEIMLSYSTFVDMHILYYLNKAGKGYYMNENMATYRVHSTGMWSGMSVIAQLHTGIDWAGEIYRHEKNEDTTLMLRQKIYFLLAYYISKMKLLKAAGAFFGLAWKYGCWNCLYMFWRKLI
jgi:glycosyltransferase involved in cell wall biosynthesis